MINIFDPPKEKARKNIRILSWLIILFLIPTGYFATTQNWIGTSGFLCLVFYFLGALFTLKNVKDDLKEPKAIEEKEKPKE